MSASSAGLLASLYSSSVSSEERSKVSAKLECITADPEAAMLILSEISQATSCQTIILFGLLSMLEQWIHRNLSKIILKYSKIVSCIAVAHYPDQWPSMIPDLLHLWSGNIDAVVLLVVHALTNLLCECADTDFSTSLPPLRRQTLIAPLTEQAPDILACACAYLASTVDRPSSTIPSDVMRMLVPLASLVPPQDISTPARDVILLVSSALQMPALSLDAVHLLIAIVAHPLPQDMFVNLASALPRIKYAAPPSSSSSCSRCFEWERSLSDALHLMLCENMDAAYIPAALPLVSELLGLAMALLRTPSRRLALDATGHWLRLLKIQAVYDIPHIHVFLMSALEIFVQHCCKLRWIDDYSGSPEFEDRDEYLETYGLQRGKFREFARLVMTRYEEQVIEYLHRSLLATLAAFPSVSDHEAADGTNSSAYLYWELAGYVVSVVAREALQPGGPRSLQQTSQTIIASIIDIALAARPTDSLLMLERLNWLDDLAPLSSSKQHMQAVLSQLAQTAAEPANCTAVRSRACAVLSSIASRSVERVHELSLIVWTCELVHSVMNSSSLVLSPGQRTSLIEVVLILSEKIVSIEERARLLLSVLSEHVSVWTTAATIFSSPATLLAHCLSETISPTPSGALRATLSSLLSIAGKISTKSISSQEFASMQSLCASFPFAIVWDAILDGVVNAVGCVHNLYDPSFRINQIKTNASLNIYTSQALLRPADSADEKHLHSAIAYIDAILLLLYQLLGQAAAHRALYLHTCHSRLTNTLQSSLCYANNNHITLLLKHFFERYIVFSSPSQYRVITATTSLILKNIHYRFLVITSPSGDNTTFSEQEKYFVYLYAQCGIVSRASVSAEELEVLRNDILYGLSRSCIDLFSAWFGQRGILAVAASPKQVIEDQQPNAIQSSREREIPIGNSTKRNSTDAFISNGNQCDFMIEENIKKEKLANISVLLLGSQFGLHESFLAAAVIMITLPDAYTCRKAIKLLDGLIEIALNDKHLTPAICVEAFSAAVNLLLRQQPWIIGVEGEIIDFIQHIYCAASFKETAADKARPVYVNMNPRNIISGLPHVQHTDVSQLDAKLQSDKGCKRRREVFRDFLKTVIASAGGSISPDGILARPSGTVNESKLQIRKNLAEYGISSNENAIDVFDVSILFS